MRKLFKQPAFASRFRSAPDLIDRVRIAGVAAVGAFIALALALLSHFAIAGDPLALPSFGGRGEVLTAPEKPPARREAGPAVRPLPTTSPNGASAGTGPVSAGGSPGPAASDSPRNAGAPKPSGSGPRTLGVSVGDSVSSAPAATPAPAPSTGSGASTGTSGGNGSSGTAGTGGSQQDPTTPPATITQPPSPANDWGHSPVGPPAPSTSSTPGRSTGTASTTPSAAPAAVVTTAAAPAASPPSVTGRAKWSGHGR